MSQSPVLVEIGDDFVADITLNRPDQLNTFTYDLAQTLIRVLGELDVDDRVRVMVLKGAGRGFCAGIDIGFLPGKNTSEYQHWIECMTAPLLAISRLRKPVIAQVHGVAAANGAGLVAACDLAVASEKARLGLTAINIGLNCIGPVMAVRRSVGRKRALEMLLSGDLIPAGEALAMGLINRVVAETELAQETRAWAAALAAKSPVAMQISKSAFYAAEDMTYGQSFAYTNEVFARLCSTADAGEGVCAFLEKRIPNWQGQ